MNLYCMSPAHWKRMPPTAQDEVAVVYTMGGGWRFYTAEQPTHRDDRLEGEYEATELVIHEALRGRVIGPGITPFVNSDRLKAWADRQVELHSITPEVAAEVIAALEVRV